MRRSVATVLFAVLVASILSMTSTSAIAAPAAPTTTEPAPVPGENITYTGNIGTPGPRTVIVQKVYNGNWFSYDESQTDADGDYSVEVGTTATTARTFRVFAPAENGQQAVASDTFELQTVQPDAPTTTDPDPSPGGTVTYKGNIGVDGSRTVTVQKEYNGKWYAQESRQTEADGDYSVPVTNAALTPRTFRIFAPASGTFGALTTKTFVVKVAVPEAPTTAEPQPFAGQTVTYSGNIGTEGPRTVILQKSYKGAWYTADTATTSATGDYSVDATNIASTPRNYRVVAPAENGKSSVTTEEFVITPKKDAVALSIYRVGSELRAAGLADPVIPGRLFALQYKSGTSSYTQIGAKVAADDEGKITIAASISGDRTYRLVGDPPAAGASSVVSNSVTFRKGPSNLGKNVIYVTTDSGTTPVTKGIDYPGTATIVSGGDVSDPLDLETIAVRGNTSSTKPKKPYKLKFEDKAKPFGLKSDKTWILLANYGDWSLIRSRVAWDVGVQLDGLKWTPKNTFTEVYVNGYYKGSYQLVESVKIDANRVNVDKEKGQVIEFDPHYTGDGVPGFQSPIGLHYSWKDPDEFKFDGDDPDPEGLTNEKIADMKKKILNFENVLYGPESDRRDWSEDWDDVPAAADWTTYLDMNSAVDYYLAREFTKDNDADMYRSNFFYTNNVDPDSPDKFFMGPIWDFDRSAGACDSCTTSVASPSGWWMRGDGSPNHDTNKIHWFTRIAKDPRFLNALHDRWEAKKNVFKDASVPVAPNVASGVYRAVAALGGSDTASGYQVAANDRAVWGSFGSRYHARTSSYPGEVAWVRNWYEARYNWMNAELMKTPPPIS